MGGTKGKRKKKEKVQAIKWAAEGLQEVDVVALPISGMGQTPSLFQLVKCVILTNALSVCVSLRL